MNAENEQRKKMRNKYLPCGQNRKKAKKKSRREDGKRYMSEALEY